MQPRAPAPIAFRRRWRRHVSPTERSQTTKKTTGRIRKVGTVTKKTPGYYVRQTTAVFLVFICKTRCNTVKHALVFVCVFCCVLWYSGVSRLDLLGGHNFLKKSIDCFVTVDDCSIRVHQSNFYWQGTAGIWQGLCPAVDMPMLW